RILETALVIADADIAPGRCLLSPLLIHRREYSAASRGRGKGTDGSARLCDDLKLTGARAGAGDRTADAVGGRDLKGITGLIGDVILGVRDNAGRQCAG